MRFGNSCAAVTHQSKPTPGGERLGKPIGSDPVKASGEVVGIEAGRNAESEHPSLGTHAFDVVLFLRTSLAKSSSQNEA